MGENAKVTNQVDNSNHSTNINIFTFEDTSHITAEKLREVANECWDGDLDGDAHIQFLVEAFKLIFSDPARPENITCYLPKPDARNAVVRGNAGWRKEPANKVCERALGKVVRTVSGKVAGGDAGYEMSDRVNNVRDGYDPHAVRRLTRGQKAEFRGPMHDNAQLVDND